MFKLNIECTKDITFLKINFADGTSSVIGNDPDQTPERPKTSKSPQPERIRKPVNRVRKEREDNLPIDGDCNFMPQSGIKSGSSAKLPEIADVKRPVKVADELQNLDI